jgi:hypothetical protein
VFTSHVHLRRLNLLPPSAPAPLPERSRTDTAGTRFAGPPRQRAGSAAARSPIYPRSGSRVRVVVSVAKAAGWAPRLRTRLPTHA